MLPKILVLMLARHQVSTKKRTGARLYCFDFDTSCQAVVYDSIRNQMLSKG